MPTTKRAPSTQEPNVAASAATPEGVSSAAAPSPDEPVRGTNRGDTANGGRGSVGRILVRLLRLAVLVAVVVGVSGAIYYGWPIVYDRVIAPVQTNTLDLGALRDRIVQLEAEVATLGATDAVVRADVAALNERLVDHDRRLAALDAMDAALAASDAAAAEIAARQIRLLKGMELMSRARLFLYQSNYGLAEQDLKAARAILADLPIAGVIDGEAVIPIAVERLDRAIDALPVFPVAASDELDIAWGALLGGVPVPTLAPESEPASSAPLDSGASTEPTPSTSP